MIALASLLFVAWSIYYWLRRHGFRGADRTHRRAVVPGLRRSTYGHDYVAMDDPQWLAHAVMMYAAARTLERQGRHTPHHPGRGSDDGGGMESNTCCFPCHWPHRWWLLWRSRPAFAKWVLNLAVRPGFRLRAGLVASRLRMFTSLDEPPAIPATQAIVQATAALRCFAPLVVLWVIALVRAPLGVSDSGSSLSMRSSPLAVGVFAAGGAGVEVNAFFDALIAISLAAGLAVEQLSLETTPQWGPAAALSLAICLVGYAVNFAPVLIKNMRNIDAREQAALRTSR